MEGTMLGDFLNLINSIGTFLIGVVALIGVFRIVLKVTFKNEVLFGLEADQRYDRIKHNLTDDRLAGDYKYDGGDARIFNQLVFSRCNSDPKLIDPRFKGSSKCVRYYYIDTANNEKKVKIWYLK